MNSDEHFDVVVVGGGAVGTSVARALAARGAGRVALLEAAHLAAGSTSRAAGIVSALTWDPCDARLVMRSAEIYRETAREAPGRFRFLEGGMLSVVGGEPEQISMAERAAMLAELGVKVVAMKPEEARGRWPDLRVDGIAAAWYTPDDGHVYAYDYVSVVGERLREAGVRVRSDEPVRRVLFEGDRARGVETSRGVLHADVVVLAAGVWSRRLLAASAEGTKLGDDLDIPLKPYRTQVAVLEADTAPRLPILHELSLEFYWIPDGRKIIFGDGTEEREADLGAWNEGNDEAFLVSVAGRLPERFRGGEEARRTGGWAGLCAATPDRRPLLGPHPAARGLQLACGFNGFGVMRAPAVGEVVADLTLGREPAIPVASHLAARFRGFVDFPIRQGFSVHA